MCAIIAFAVEVFTILLCVIALPFYKTCPCYVWNEWHAFVWFTTVLLLSVGLLVALQIRKLRASIDKDLDSARLNPNGWMVQCVLLLKLAFIVFVGWELHFTYHCRSLPSTGIKYCSTTFFNIYVTLATTVVISAFLDMTACSCKATKDSTDEQYI